MPPERAAALRIGVAAVWLYELVRIFPWQSDLYETGVAGQKAVFGFWILVTVALLVGFLTRWAAAFSAACFLVFVNLGGEIYHIDYYAQLATCYLIVIDAGAVWSVDSVIARRSGRLPVSSIWALPVLALLVHVSFTYLDAAGSHLLLNDFWQDGSAVGRSWNHPQWGSWFSAVLGWLPGMGRLATWGTAAIEGTIWVAVVVFVLDRQRRRRLGAAIAGLLLLLHLAIVLTYAIGTFGIFMIVLLSPYLPWERISRAVRVVAPSPDRQGEGPLVMLLAVILTLAFITIQPLETLSERLGLGAVRRGAIAVLDLVGDHRPHDVFSDEALTYAFAFSVRDESGLDLGLLFDDDGHRLNDVAYIRVYMGWHRLGQPMARALDNGEVIPPLDHGSFRSVVSPVLQRAADNGMLQRRSRYEVWYRAWVVGEKEPVERSLGDAIRWVEFDIDLDNQIRLVRSHPLTSSRSPAGATDTSGEWGLPSASSVWDGSGAPH